MRNAHSACCLLRQVKDARETKEGREEASPNSVGLVFSLALCVARAIQGYHPQPRKNLDRNFCETALNQRIIYLSDLLLEATSNWVRVLAALLHMKYCSSSSFKLIHLHLFSHRTPFNYLLVNLAAADIVYPSFLLSHYIVSLIVETADEMPGNAICMSLSKAAWVGAFAGVFTMIVVARERYYTVVHPHGIKGKLTTQSVKVCK